AGCSPSASRAAVSTLRRSGDDCGGARPAGRGGGERVEADRPQRNRSSASGVVRPGRGGPTRGFRGGIPVARGGGVAPSQRSVVDGACRACPRRKQSLRVEVTLEKGCTRPP